MLEAVAVSWSAAERYATSARYTGFDGQITSSLKSLNPVLQAAQ